MIYFSAASQDLVQFLMQESWKKTGEKNIGGHKNKKRSEEMLRWVVKKDDFGGKKAIFAETDFL